MQGSDLQRAIGEVRGIAPLTRPFETLAEQARHVREFSLNPQQRVRIGIPTLDAIIDGPAGGEVYNILGRSFAGKSMLGLNILANNRDLGSIFFSLEMPARMAVQRLYCMVTGVEYYPTLHDQIKQQSLPSTFEQFANELPLHVVIDQNNVSLESMANYVDSYESYFGHRPDFVVMDYLELIGGAKASGEGMLRIEAVAGEVKSFAKSHNLPVFLLHQANRSEKEYEPLSRDSARYAGYTEADVMIGMWQRHTDPALSEELRKQEFGKVYFNVLKNRVTGRLNNAFVETWMRPDLVIEDLHELKKKQRLLDVR